MKERIPIHTGDLLYHNTANPTETFCSERENAVYFGLTPESIAFIGESGYRVTYQLLDDLPEPVEYGSRMGWGFNTDQDWISIPSEIAAQILLYIETEEIG